MKEDGEKELKFVTDCAGHESSCTVIPDCPSHLSRPETVFGTASGVSAICVPGEYELLELVRVPKSFGVVMDEVIHGM